MGFKLLCFICILFTSGSKAVPQFQLGQDLLSQFQLPQDTLSHLPSDFQLPWDLFSRMQANPEDITKEDLLEAINALSELRDVLELLPYQADPRPTVPEVIEAAGYVAEVHDITTEDGYILQAHRIPLNVTKCPETEEQKVVWLQHGLMGDSSNWVITGTNNRGLAYELADACYDVWMGNFRGNTYSKNHVNITSENRTFWDFSLHEVGVFDVPANIEYALEVTGAESLFYIGHSMGGTTFFICMSERPELNQKVKLMSGLAPVAFNNNTRNVLVRLVLDWIDLIRDLGDPIEAVNIESTQLLTTLLCNANRRNDSQLFCGFVLGLIGGFNVAQLDYDNLPAILQHSPAGSSSKVFLHYGQGIKSGDFKQFDYGTEEKNLLRYNQTTPPHYNFKNMVAPIAFYWGDNDLLADKRDILKSIEHFPNAVRNYRIDDDKFAHLDFVWALDQHNLVNQPVMQFMEEFANGGPVITQKNGALKMTPLYHLGVLVTVCILWFI